MNNHRTGGRPESLAKDANRQRGAAGAESCAAPAADNEQSHLKTSDGSPQPDRDQALVKRVDDSKLVLEIPRTNGGCEHHRVTDT